MELDRSNDSQSTVEEEDTTDVYDYIAEIYEELLAIKKMLVEITTSKRKFLETEPEPEPDTRRNKLWHGTTSLSQSSASIQPNSISGSYR